MLDIALECIARGWSVFPCQPGTKEPFKGSRGFLDATNAEIQIRSWWNKYPDANVGIATCASALTVLDVDAGIDNADTADFFCGVFGRETYAVRTGRRPEFGLQVYFTGGDQQSVPWARADDRGAYSGDVRSATGYVMAAGSLHPSGKRYEVFRDWRFDIAPLPFAPQWIRELNRPERKTADGKLLQLGKGDGQHDRMTQHAGRFRAMGYDGDQILAALIPLNEIENVPPLPERDISEIAYGVAARYPPGEVLPEVVIGPKTPAEDSPVDWRARYHSYEEIRDAPPVSFLIEGFLTEDAVTAIAAPVGQRKSLIAMNLCRSLLTGEKLFGHFPVVKQPGRVIYLCPEMGIQSFSQRMKALGLLEYVGKRLFCQTMTSESLLALDDLTDEELSGAVVILDTAIRFLRGDENSSEHMQGFATSVFRLQRSGSLAVVLLHHSGKGTTDSADLTLENSMRGSGELGAFVACCWATRLQNPKDKYGSPSYLENVKQRDFKSRDPFEVTGDLDTCILTMITPDGKEAKLRSKTSGNRDGEEDRIVAFLRTNPDMASRKAEDALKELGLKRGYAWINKKRREMREEAGETGVLLKSA
jgi:Bifunctional DNA primase/polymerase, N-terminal/AAA domain